MKGLNFISIPNIVGHKHVNGASIRQHLPCTTETVAITTGNRKAERCIFAEKISEIFQKFAL